MSTGYVGDTIYSSVMKPVRLEGERVSGWALISRLPYLFMWLSTAMIIIKKKEPCFPKFFVTASSFFCLKKRGEILISKKEFVCKLDGRSFGDRDEALRYLEAQYLDEIEHIEGLGHYEERLKNLFPDYIIKITKRVLEENEHQFSHYYKQGDKEEMHVTMEGVKIASTFEFSFVERENVDPGWEYGWNMSGHSHFHPSFDIALDHYKRLIGHGEIYRQKYAEEISKYRSDIKTITLKEIYEASGCSDDYNRYTLEIVLENGKTFSDSFFFSFDQMETSQTLLENINANNARIKGSYLSYLEGEVTMGYSRHYYHDNQTWYEVDNIPIASLLQRAKRVKIEILEEKAET